MERLFEIWASIRANKLRTFLTGFSVAWGIFMLVLLLGVGNGLKNGYSREFNDDAINSIWISKGQTSIPFAGMQPGRQIKFTNQDYDYVKSNIEGIDKISSRWNKWDGFAINYKNNSGNYSVRGVHPDHQFAEKTIMIKGRYINESDIVHKRKVIAIGQIIVDEIFKTEEPLGNWVSVNGIPFQVVGVYKDDGAENENKMIYIPVSTAQATFNGGNEIDQIILTTTEVSLEKSQLMALQITKDFAARKKFDEADPRAIFVRNNYENFQRFIVVLQGMEAFIWIIGIMTIIAGIVGVSNIMMITVKERTKEIGIRKALGATPKKIVGMIVQESILITTIAGYVGLAAGILLLEAVGAMIPKEGAVFANPEVKFEVAVAATLLLIIAGSLAGFFPALRAAKLKPVEALMDE
jgi:putative ABC transport system permease protein